MAGISLAAGASVVFFGTVHTGDTEHGEPLVVTSTGGGVKVTPFADYPAEGRATGGARAHRLLKGESRLAIAWVGQRPAATTDKGEPVELPAEDRRRDGSGTAITGSDIIGDLIERGRQPLRTSSGPYRSNTGL
jgi:DNA gyrase subunit A